jgi:hypothetical protein
MNAMYGTADATFVQRIHYAVNSKTVKVNDLFK